MREDLLGTGVAGLSKAGADEGWFAGHFGAAIISGYFLVNDFGLEPEVTRLIEAKLDQIVETFPAFFPPPTSGEAPGDHAGAILEQLAPALQKVANSGHGVIYGSLALRAMRVMPALETQSACQNIANLVARATQHDPSRYLGFEDPCAVEVPDDAFPKACDLATLTRAAIAECGVVYPDEEIAGRRHFFNGEKIHGVTHAQALADLDALGHGALGQSGCETLRKQLFLSRQTPPGGRAESPRTELLPTQEAFWRTNPRDALHVVKLSYAGLAAADRLAAPRSEVLSALAAVWNLA